MLPLLYCNPKGRRALLRIPTTEGRSVCLCWAKSKPKGPNGPKDLKGGDDSATHREPSALYCWILEILYCTPKGRRALPRIQSTEERSVCLCWAPFKPQGPEGWCAFNTKHRSTILLEIIFRNQAIAAFLSGLNWIMATSRILNGRKSFHFPLAQKFKWPEKT